MPSPYSLKIDRYSSHACIATCIRAKALRAHNPYTVLDIGCASGFLRHFLPAPDFYLIGVEYNRELVVQAKALYDQVHQTDLNLMSELDLPQRPDAVVFGDILEHLANPELVFSHILKQNVTPGTQVVISLPNIAHAFVRLSLLLGRFDYADRGILDRTHLRFFTLKTAQQLCVDCCVRITTMMATPTPLPLISSSFAEGRPLFPLYVANAILAHRFKTLLGYQFILDGFYDP
jgi:2-polyprenyl-3-methyl-5-hydroxy-6-metoxy-1,4-benzoquinol methylase